MADQLVIDAQKKLLEFASVWLDRANEFVEKGMLVEAHGARRLATVAVIERDNLCDILDKDKKLDKAYDKLKEKVRA
jgi:hypothetical protein